MGFFTMPLFFGMTMAAVDVVVLSLLKAKYNGNYPILNTPWILVLAFVLYGFQTLIFYKSLSYGGLTQMNLMWDLSSDLLVTFIGLFFFMEAVTISQKIGIILGIMSIILLK